MDVILIDRIETGAERGASALLAAAVGYAAYEFLGGLAFRPQLGGYVAAAAAAVAACLLCNAALKQMTKRPPRLRVPIFDLREFDAFGPDELLLTDKLNGELILTDEVCDELLLTDTLGAELLLTDSERLSPVAAAPGPASPLVLDDVLAEIGPESRVVRLFDRSAMPTPGQLKLHIDDHLGPGSPKAAPMDATQALSDALAELKRSLR